MPEPLDEWFAPHQRACRRKALQLVERLSEVGDAGAATLYAGDLLADTTQALYIGAPRSRRLITWSARAAAKLGARLALARSRKVVRGLDAEQLTDAGIDASTILPQRPTIAIEGGLMTRLMSMR